MRVVLYERNSSKKQNVQSIEGQDKVCREYYSRKGFEIVDVYIDRNISAYKDVKKRESFQRMIKDSALH